MPKSTKSATTVLWFLVGCLTFTETFLGFFLERTDVDPLPVLIIGVVALGLILGTLLLMYLREPAFLTLEGKDASKLTIILALIRGYGPALPTEIIRMIISGDVVKPVDEKLLAKGEPKEPELTSFEDELEKLSSNDMEGKG